MNRRRQFIRALAVGGTTGVAGCLGENSSDGTDGSDDTEGTNDTDTEGTNHTDTEGTASIGSDEAVRMGLLAPLHSRMGAEMVNAAELAAREINEAGGIDGAEVEILGRDTKGDPSTGRRVYRELVSDESVDVTTGVLTNVVLRAIMDDIAAAQTVHLTTGAVTPQASAKVHDDYELYRYHFRTGPLNSAQQGQFLADFGLSQFSSMGWNSVAMLLEDYKWTLPIERVVGAALRQSDVDLVMTKRVRSDTRDFGRTYDTVESAGADAAFVAMGHTGVPAVSTWAREKRPFGFGGVHVPSRLPSFYEDSGGAAAYVLTQTVATPQSELTEKTQPFVGRYQRTYQELPASVGYTTYDAVKQYAAVVDETGTTDAEAVVDGLETSSYTGTTGTIEYHSKGHDHAHDVIYSQDAVTPVVQQWQPDGNSATQEVIYPPEHATSEYRQPEWL